MKYVAAYLLAVLGGNPDPDTASITKVLQAAGVEIDQTKLEELLSEVKGKKLDSLLAEGQEKLREKQPTPLIQVQQPVVEVHKRHHDDGDDCDCCCYEAYDLFG